MRIKLLSEQHKKVLEEMKDNQSSIAALTKQRRSRIAYVDNTGLGLLQPVPANQEPIAATSSTRPVQPKETRQIMPAALDAATGVSGSGARPPSRSPPTPPPSAQAKKPRQQ